MDVIEAINSRKSVRSFKPDPVPREVLRTIIEAALRAPSWGNTQPWEFAVLGGEVMNKVRAAIVDKISSGEKPNPDLPWPTFVGPYLERTRTDGRHLFQELGIAKEDRQAKANWRLSMTQFFYAPNGIIVYMDASLGQ